MKKNLEISFQKGPEHETTPLKSIKKFVRILFSARLFYEDYF